ncbi:MAG TPA: ABC transporter permease [Gemmataceae bacterium]|nr:ABC transporter permease [Gemmataceae bacterium]
MRKMLVIAVREYLAAVRTKAFIIGLVIMPILMGGSVVVQWLLKDFHDIKEKHFIVVDRTPGAQLVGPIKDIVKDYNETQTHDPQTGKQVQPRFDVQSEPPSEAIDEQRVDLSDRVATGELFGFLDIGPDVLEASSAADARKESHSIRYQSNRPTNESFPRLMRDKLIAKVQDLRFDAAQVKTPREKVRRIMQPVPVESKGLTRRDHEGKPKDANDQIRLAPVAVPMGLMMLMFMIIMMSATPLMQGVVEEKMQRIAEVLLASVRPFELMLGKLLGMTAVSLTITAVYLAGAYWSAHEYGFAEYIPGALLVWFFLFQMLAALMYGSLFIAIGAACTDMKETQNLLWPVMMLAIMPMFVLGNVLQEPNSAVATGLSFFPFATPMLMILRQSVQPGVESWQPILGAAIVLATTLACVWAAGRIFRVGILMQGKGAQLGEMMRWVFRG